MTEGSISQIRARLKLVFLGDQGTGKTSIITRFMSNRFEEGIGPTVGIDFLAKNVTIGSNVVRLQLWDTAGQERFRSLIPNYLKDAMIALIVFDVTNKKSFENLNDWLELFNQNKQEKAIAVLVGNKTDSPAREVTAEQARQKAEQFHIEYVETSAKTASNIESLFINSTKSALGMTGNYETSNTSMGGSQIRSERKSIEGVSGPTRSNISISGGGMDLAEKKIQNSNSLKEADGITLDKGPIKKPKKKCC